MGFEEHPGLWGKVGKNQDQERELEGDLGAWLNILECLGDLQIYKIQRSKWEKKWKLSLQKTWERSGQHESRKHWRICSGEETSWPKKQLGLQIWKVRKNSLTLEIR